MPDPPMPQKKVGVSKSVSVAMPTGYAGRVSDRQPDPLPAPQPPLVAVVAPSCPITLDLAERVTALADGRVRLRWAGQCFATGSHFAGPDRAREDALVDAWNDPEVAAVWCARGGAGAARVAEAAVARFDPAVSKPLLGYSDAGFLHAALLVAGRGGAVWGPMPGDLARPGGEVAVERALRWLAGSDAAEDHAAPPGEAVAFNLTVLCATLGTPLEPPLAGRVLMLEDVGEPLYRVDRDAVAALAPVVVRGVGGGAVGAVLRVGERPAVRGGVGRGGAGLVRRGRGAAARRGGGGARCGQSPGGLSRLKSGLNFVRAERVEALPFFRHHWIRQEHGASTTSARTVLYGPARHLGPPPQLFSFHPDCITRYSAVPNAAFKARIKAALPRSASPPRPGTRSGSPR